VIAVLVVGILVMLACLAFQAAALVFAAQVVERITEHQVAPSRASTKFLQLSILMIVLMLGNIVQIVIWALLYRGLGALDDLETAVYFSGVTFTTLGYGDVVLKGRIRLLAPLQAANGVMMFGITTAAFISVVERALVQRIGGRVSGVSPQP
jgi:hypothetical protein